MPDNELTYLGESSPAVIAGVPVDSKLVLDLGCGRGGNARLLRARGIAVDGVTVSELEAKEATAYCAAVYIHDLEAGLPDIPGRPLYDAVICSHVLEHVAYPDKMLADIRKHLKPTGVLIVALPNLLLWKSRLRLMRGEFEYTESGLMDRSHVRWYSFASARRLLETHGFTVTEARVDGGLPLGPLRRILPQAWLQPLDRAACKAVPGLLGYEMIYMARGGELGTPEF